MKRAELVRSTLLGLLVHRTAIGGATRDDNELVVALVAPTLQASSDGPGRGEWNTTDG
jgi:hypothetical protein